MDDISILIVPPVGRGVAWILICYFTLRFSSSNYSDAGIYVMWWKHPLRHRHPETYSALNNHRPFIVFDCDKPFIDRRLGWMTKPWEKWHEWIKWYAFVDVVQSSIEVLNWYLKSIPFLRKSNNISSANSSFFVICGLHEVALIFLFLRFWPGWNSFRDECVV